MVTWGVMKRAIIINSLVSFIVSVVIIGISLIDKENSIQECLRFGLYDFIILEVFLMVLELYIYFFSDYLSLLKNKKYRNFLKNLSSFVAEKNNNLVIKCIIKILLEECEEYCKSSNISSFTTSVYLIDRIKNELCHKCKTKKFLCDIKDFCSDYINQFDETVVFYNNYAELYRFSRLFAQISLTDGNVKFYRRNETSSLKTFFILDHKYVFVKRDVQFYNIYMDENLVQRYIEDFIKIKNESVLWGKTQEQDSLFLNQSVREFYGDGNIPELHLDKIQTEYNTILDLGTGTGRLLYYFRDSGKYQVTAMDKDSMVIDECCKKFGQHSHIKFLNEEFNEMSFEPQKFDIVIAYNSLYHTDRTTMYKIISRVKIILKDGGHFLLTLKTLEGNESLYKNAREIIPEHPENTFLDTKFPDYYLPHHFCDNEEIDMYIRMFSKVIYRESIPYKEYNGDIVQGEGIYLILQK